MEENKNPVTQAEHFPPEKVDSEKKESVRELVQKLKKKKWYRNPKILIPLAVVLVVGISVLASTRGPEAEYVTETVQRMTLKNTVSATGTVQALTERDLQFEANGVIDKILVEEGDQVQEGEVLATLETTDLDIQIREARAALALAQANLQIVFAGNRQEDIQVSQESVKQAETAYQNALKDHEALVKKT